MVGDEMEFEEAFGQAEAIARRMESGSLPLEESLEAFKEAMRLLDMCSKKISIAEKEIQVILDSRDGMASLGELAAIDSDKCTGKEE